MEQQQTFFQKVEIFFFKVGVGVGLVTTLAVGGFFLATFLDDGGGKPSTPATVIEQQN